MYIVRVWRDLNLKNCMLDVKMKSMSDLTYSDILRIFDADGVVHYFKIWTYVMVFKEED